MGYDVEIAKRASELAEIGSGLRDGLFMIGLHKECEAYKVPDPSLLQSSKQDLEHNMDQSYALGQV